MGKKPKKNHASQSVKKKNSCKGEGKENNSCRRKGPIKHENTFHHLTLDEINYSTKYMAENAENSISEPRNFKIFWGSMPPDPPIRVVIITFL